MSALKHQMKGTNMKWHLRKKTERALHTLKCVSKLWIYSLAATHPNTHSLYLRTSSSYTLSNTISKCMCSKRR